MPDINIDAILNGTPIKRINNAHDKLVTEGLSESSAKEFYDVYSNEPLSAILECSRFIFSEPYYGTSFYMEKVCKPSSCLFVSPYNYSTELNKVSTFIEEVKDKIPDTQLALYEKTKDALTALCDQTKASTILATFIEREDKGFNENLIEAIYSKNEDEILNIFKESNETELITYLPYISSEVGFETNETLYENAKSIFLTEKIDESNWKTHTRLVVAANKLATDKAYTEAVRGVPASYKNMINYYCESSLFDHMNEMSKTKVSYMGGVDDPQISVNNIFFAMQESALFAEDYNEKKETIRKIKKVAYESTLDLLDVENDLYESDSNGLGYTLVPGRTSVSDLYDKVALKYSEYYSEADDDEDPEIPDAEEDEPETTPDRLGGNTSGKKIKAPEAKNLANKIQNKAMDREVQHNKRKAVRKQKGQEIVNAADAATRVPRQAIAEVKEMIRKLDEKDDERRKNYMTEPGFRKKAFKNLKLAILYGGAAYTKLALIPVVMMARHYSKKKDKRMMFELSRELNTEIKICEEKIQDANANEDKTEKYRLMRIHDRLEAELVRVQTNSKYI